MSKYSEDLQIEDYIKHKQQEALKTISKEDLLKVFDYNLDKLEEVHLKKVKIGNILIDFQMLRGLIESNKIV
tara:strand:- start:643 stop:858 length:216 start_codon:yes stop_codon:yes gene_type:complete